MSCTVVPRAGSSGSPIIDVENGSVIGIMRGAVQGYGDRMKRGFATPAEKIFEVCRRPPNFLVIFC
jgi:S1-C subfamily serine protease